MDGQFTLSCLGKFGPVASYRRIQIQLSLIDEPMGAESREALTCRIDIDDCAPAPRRLRVSTRKPSPEIHHHSLVDADGNRSAYLVPLFAIPGERVSNLLERRVAVSVDVHSNA